MTARTALENVEREIDIMKTLSHPNLVSLLEVIDAGPSRLFLVLEYCTMGEIMTNVRGTGTYRRKEGETFVPGVVVVPGKGHFDEETAALYFVDVMHGLAHLHGNCIVHRDLKPEVREMCVFRKQCISWKAPHVCACIFRKSKRRQRSSRLT